MRLTPAAHHYVSSGRRSVLGDKSTALVEAIGLTVFCSAAQAILSYVLHLLSWVTFFAANLTTFLNNSAEFEVI